MIFSATFRTWMTSHSLTFHHATSLWISGSQGSYSSSMILENVVGTESSLLNINFIKSLILEHPTIYLDEIQEQLLTQWGTQILISMLMCTLSHMLFSNKDVSSHTLVQNIEQCAIFMNQMADLVEHLNMLMFGDEAGKNEHTFAQRLGWSLWGTRFVQQQWFVCGQWYSNCSSGSSEDSDIVKYMKRSVSGVEL